MGFREYLRREYGGLSYRVMLCLWYNEKKYRYNQAYRMYLGWYHDALRLKALAKRKAEA